MYSSLSDDFHLRYQKEQCDINFVHVFSCIHHSFTVILLSKTTKAIVYSQGYEAIVVYI